MADTARTAADAAGRVLCRADALLDKGDAVVFDVVHRGVPVSAFALRYEGRLVAYLNRCSHVAAEMDWLPGKFLDDEREFILCSIHGAAYEPLSGACAGGPCGRSRLTPVAVGEVDGEVRWYPSSDTHPRNAAPSGPAAESPP